MQFGRAWLEQFDYVRTSHTSKSQGSTYQDVYHFDLWILKSPLIPEKALKTKFQFPTNDLNDDVELLVELYPPKPFKPKNKNIDKQKSNVNHPNPKNGASQNGMDSGTGQTLDDSTDQGFELFGNTIFAFHLIGRFLESFCEC